MAGVAEFGGNRAGNGGIHIGVVKHDKGRVAAEFERHFFDAAGALAHQLAAGFGGAGEAEFAHQRVFGQHFSDGAGGAGDDVEHARRNACLFGQRRQRQRGKRRLRCGAHDKGAAGGQRGRGFAGDHRIGKIPRRDGGTHADRLFEHQHAAVGRGRGDGVAVHPFGLLGIPLDIRRAVGNLALGLGQRLALLQSQDFGQRAFVFQHQIKPAAQQRGTLAGAFGAPVRKRGIGSLNGAFGLRRAHIRHAADGFAGSGIVHRQHGTIIGIQPAAADIGLGFEQGGIGGCGEVLVLS